MSFSRIFLFPWSYMTGVTAMTLRMSMSISVPEYGPYTTPIMPFTKPTPTQIPKLKKPVFRETYSLKLFFQSIP